MPRLCAERWPRTLRELDERPIDRFDRGVWGLRISLEVRRVWAIEEPAPSRRNGCPFGVYGRELPRRLTRPVPKPDPRSRIRQRVERRAIFRDALEGMHPHPRALPASLGDDAPPGADDEARGSAVAARERACPSARPCRFRSCRVISGHSLRRVRTGR